MEMVKISIKGSIYILLFLFYISALCTLDQCINCSVTATCLLTLSGPRRVILFYRLEPHEVLDDNKRNLLEMTQKVFTAIVESAPK